MAKKKIKPIFEELQPPRDLRIFGCCNTAPHTLRAKLAVVGFHQPLHMMLTTTDVDLELSLGLRDLVVYVCTDVRLARRLFQHLLPTDTVIVCDAAMKLVSVTNQFLDAEAYKDDARNDAWNVRVKNNWQAIWKPAFPCVCGNYDHPRALISDVSRGSLLNPLFTLVYKIPRDSQPPVKDLIVTSIMEHDPDVSRPMLEKHLPLMLPDQSLYNKIMHLLFDDEYSSQYLKALIEVRPYAVQAVELDDFPSEELAKKYKLDAYELRYFLQVYKRIIRNNGTTTLEDGFFQHRDELIAHGHKNRGNLTVGDTSTVV